ncbi:hypothetical protein FRB99_002502 [Tulasnella sp. 403]|nr:hypothetical protein FRB99_002502 [Tulasnella sp. 403]
MVLGITLRRKKTKEEPPVIRPSPSLPNIAATGLSTTDWPEALVDINTIKKEVIIDENLAGGTDHGHQAPYKTSFHPNSQPGVPSFHRPFRPAGADGDQQPGAVHEGTNGRKSIASIYSSNAPPSSFMRSPTYPALAQKPPSIRRITRVFPKFNLMVAGGKGTGKTSLLKLFLNTCDISPTASEPDVVGVKKFTEGATKQTKALKTVAVEVCEERHERIHLTVIDTVGFDFEEGKELELERGVSSLVKYLDTQFAETMGEESKVVRQNKGDKHVHLCIYLIDPETIMRPAARRAKAALPFGVRSQSTLHRRASLSSITSTESSESSEEDEKERPSAEKGEENEEEEDEEGDEEVPKPPARKSADETMAPKELRVLKRLATRCNILPVIAHADTLTDERLALVRKVVRRDLKEIGLRFGVFEPPPKAEGLPTKHPRSPRRATQFQVPAGPPSDEESDEERDARPVIKLRSHRGAVRDRSRSRRRMLELDDDDDFHAPQSPGPDSVASPVQPTSGSWPKQSKADLASMLPFAIISPEEPPKPRSSKKRSKGGTNGTADPSSANANGAASADQESKPAGRRPSFRGARAYIRGPAELQGQFVRRYRWGTIDVLDPAHCDFVAMRTAVLGTHMRTLKNNTKEVLYEKYRTEKLLARRATQTISDADRKKLLHGMGIA